jgi:hypothetical protein
MSEGPLLPVFLHEFLLPLVAGGDVRVRRPLGARELQQLDDELIGYDDGEEADRFAEARHAVAAELLPSVREPKLDEDSLRLGVALNNLLYLSHPSTHGAFVRNGKLKRIAAWTAEIATLAAPTSSAELVARHALLVHLFDIGRDDVRVSFWAGKREFKGSLPPARLYKWSRVRRVHEERWRVDVLAESLTDAHGQREIVAALLESSPLTDLLTTSRPEPPLELAGRAIWLRDVEIARAVADRWLSDGIGVFAQPFVAALVSLCNRPEQASEAATAVRFLCHLHLLSLLSRRGHHLADEETLRGEVAAQLAAHVGARDWLGLFAVAQPLGLGRPADLARNPALSALVDRYAAACAAAVGEERLRELGALIARAAHTSLQLPPAEPERTPPAP